MSHSKMTRIGTVIWAIFCLMTGLTAPPFSSAQNKDKPAWEGTFTATVNSGFIEKLTGRLRFEYAFSTGKLNDIEDAYNLVGGSLTWTLSGAMGGCTESGGPSQMDIKESNSSGNLLIRSDGRYMIAASLDKAPPFTGTAQCGPISVTIPAGLNSLVSAPPYFNLEGTEKDGRIARGVNTVSGGSGGITYQWDLSIEPLELVVEIDDYQDWMPEAGIDEQTPGNEMTIHAWLQNPDGSRIVRPADVFRFEFPAISMEPGICLNFPSPVKALYDFDFQFLKDRNPSAEKIRDHGQWIEMPSGTETTVQLSSFDWGANSTLKATANVDGEEIVGYLKGDRKQSAILLPKRAPASLIADAWKEKMNAANLDDRDDSDNVPIGDGDKGDGFTLYEEYRGFMENGKHISTDPRKKDLFILDSLGGVSKRGIALFARATQIKVHHELRSDEFPSSRTMNANIFEGPSLNKPQHGLVMRLETDSLYSRVENIGTPGISRTVHISRNMAYDPIRLSWIRNAVGRSNSYDYSAAVVGHEMGHAVNVPHHGDKDKTNVSWALVLNQDGSIARDADSYPKIVENGNQPIQVWLEAGIRTTPLWLQGDNNSVRGGLCIGVKQGEHSGDQTCLMRYNSAIAYETTSSTRYLVIPLEEMGDRFCISSTGTGVNDKDREPQPRYGDTLFGKCMQRVCVKDAIMNHPAP
jgi:hypothetical protein